MLAHTLKPSFQIFCSLHLILCFLPPILYFNFSKAKAHDVISHGQSEFEDGWMKIHQKDMSHPGEWNNLEEPL